MVKGPLYIITCNNQACNSYFTLQDRPGIREIEAEGWQALECFVSNREYCPDCRAEHEDKG